MPPPPLCQRLPLHAALAYGFIRPAGRRRRGAGRPVYATTALVEEIEAACGEEWEAVVARLAVGATAAAAATHAPSGQRFRWHADYQGDDGRQLPVVVAMPRAGDHGAIPILAMLDGE